MQIQLQESTNQLVSKSVEQPAVPEFDSHRIDPAFSVEFVDFGRKEDDKSELKWYTLEGFLKRFYLPFLKKPATKVLLLVRMLSTAAPLLTYDLKNVCET